jgi:Zn-dependent protease with chaperone function
MLKALGANGPDRFLLPQETTFRFYALIAAVLGGFAFLWSWLFLALPYAQQVVGTRFSGCLKSAMAQPDKNTARQLAKDCLHSFNVPQAFFTLGCLVAITLAILGVYLLAPTALIRTQRLQSLAKTADPDLLPPLATALDQLVGQAGLSRSPVFLVRPRPHSEAFTFGSWFKHYICLDSGLVNEFFTRRDVFDAKLRHELAHFRNKDINKTSLTKASWWIFATIGPGIFLYCLVRQPNTVGVLGALSVRFAIIAATVYLAHRAVIRSREYYADARAFIWDGPRGALMAALEAQKQRDTGRTPRKLPGFLRLHPTAAQRVAALRQPAQLLRSGFTVPGLIGLAFGIGQPPLGFVLTQATDQLDAGLGNAIAACVFLLPLAGLASAEIWRSSLNGAGRGRADLKAAALGLASGIGIILGYQVSFMSALGAGDVYHYPGPLVSVLLMAGFFLWVRAGAYWWLSSGFGHRTVLWACWAGLALGTFVLATVWLRLSDIDSLGRAMQMSGMPDVDVLRQGIYLILANIAQYQTTFLLAATLWLYLVVPRWRSSWALARGSIVRHRAGQVMQWTLVYVLVIIAFRIAIRLLFDPDLRATDDFKFWSFQIHVMLAVLLQGGLVAFLTLRRPAGTIGEACFCAIVAGLFMSAALLIVNLVVGGSVTPSFAWLVIALIVNDGAPVALCIATLGSTLRYAIAAFRPLPVLP